MNRENILKVAEAIETAARDRKGLRGKIGFNMCAYATEAYDEEDRQVVDHVDACGTVACIAGWAYASK